MACFKRTGGKRGHHEQEYTELVASWRENASQKKGGGDGESGGKPRGHIENGPKQKDEEETVKGGGAIPHHSYAAADREKRARERQTEREGPK